MTTRSAIGVEMKRQRTNAYNRSIRRAAVWLFDHDPDARDSIDKTLDPTLGSYWRRDALFYAASVEVRRNHPETWIEIYQDETKDIPRLPLGRPRGS